MPWLSLTSHDDKRIEALKEKFAIIGIPHLVVLEPNGNILIQNGRPDVQKKGIVAFDEWINKLPK